MKPLLMGTNLKMYKTAVQTQAYLSTLQTLTSDLRGAVTLFVIPSYTALERAAETVRNKAILLGAQNMHAEEQGQFTGEISPLMLREFGLDIVEIGHSERRHVFGETDREANRKVLSALAHGFIALLCIGETAEQKAFDISDETLAIQLKTGLFSVTAESAKRVWVAYEPVWAIGADGVPASADYVKNRHAGIHRVLDALYPETEIPVLYGGSVNPGNAEELIAQPGVDGLFAGRAAWEPEKFNALIRRTLSLWRRRQQA
jgi:triosephosphate isomerase